MRTVWSLIVVFMLLTAGDAYTTWACLRVPLSGATELNPMVNWMFEAWGLVPGLIIDWIITFLVLVLLGLSGRIGVKAKMLILIAGIAITTYAIHNNYGIMVEIGVA